MLQIIEGHLQEHYQLIINQSNIHTSYKDFRIHYSIENLHIESGDVVKGNIKQITASLDIFQSISHLKLFLSDVIILQSKIQSDIQLKRNESSLDFNRVLTYLTLKKLLILNSEFKINKKNIIKIKKISSKLNQNKLSLNYVAYFDDTSLLGTGEIYRQKLENGINGNIKLHCKSLNINQIVHQSY